MNRRARSEDVMQGEDVAIGRGVPHHELCQSVQRKEWGVARWWDGNPPTPLFRVERETGVDGREWTLK